MQSIGKILATALVATVVTGCGAFGGGHSNAEPPTPLAKFKASAKLKRIWETSIGYDNGKRVVMLYPAVADGRIYAVDPGGQVGAFTSNKGKRLWYTDLKRRINGGIGSGGDMLLIGSEKGMLLALKTTDGSKRWAHQVSSEILAPPVLAGDSIFVQTADGKLFSLAARDGSEQWQQERSEPSLSLRGTAAPIVIGNRVVAGFANGKLTAFKRDDGTTIWETTIAEPRGRDEIERLVDVDATPVALGNLIYAAAYQGRVVAVQAETGSLAWSREISTYAPLALGRDRIYVVDDHGIAYALDAQTGATIWKQDQLRGRHPTAPTVFGAYIALADSDGYVHLLQQDDGAFAARYHATADTVQVRPVAYDGHLYILDRGGNLSALALK